MKHSKEEYIGIFREQADKIYAELHKLKISSDKKASEMNKRIKSFKEIKFSKILQVAQSGNWNTDVLMNELLLITYSSYIVMLEFRNDFWPYEYMSFARRIGELWEPFCKIPFYYPIKKLKLIESPTFSSIQQKIQSDANVFIETLNLDDKIKQELKHKYEIPWILVDSGGINLKLDLHFEQDGMHYNCDFKSGFSSNEKGNTNRLLLVASIFNYLGKNEK